MIEFCPNGDDPARVRGRRSTKTMRNHDHHDMESRDHLEDL
jgi:hypothetical protein